MKKHKILSPHLQVYDIFSKSMTSVVSVMDRMAFVFLLPFLFFLMLIFIVAAYNPIAYQIFINFLPNKLFYAIAFIGSIMFFYHFYATFRYILIEFGFFAFSKKAVFLSAIFVIFLSFTSVVLVWAVLLKNIAF